MAHSANVPVQPVVLDSAATDGSALAAAIRTCPIRHSVAVDVSAIWLLSLWEADLPFGFIIVVFNSHDPQSESRAQSP
jgi:hypothetical protein